MCCLEARAKSDKSKLHVQYDIEKWKCRVCAVIALFVFFTRIDNVQMR